MSEESKNTDVTNSNPGYDTLVLSGGGPRGFCLLGALQCAMDKGLLSVVKHYVGTSIGAIICYLVAIGYTPVEILVSVYTNRWLEDFHHYDLVKMVNGEGAISFTPLQNALEKLTIDKIGKFLTLEGLQNQYNKTLVCVTYNMTTCATEYLGPDNYPDLPCITALRMSANIPILFDRFKYMGSFYIDGGISDNFAIIKGEELGEKVLGIYLDIPEENLQDSPDNGIVTYFLNLLQVPVIQSTKHRIAITEKLGKSTVIGIKCGGNGYVNFDIKSKMRLNMFSTGYSAVKESKKFECTLSKQ